MCDQGPSRPPQPQEPVLLWPGACWDRPGGDLEFSPGLFFLYQDINEMVRTERPDWQNVMLYVTAIYKYFET